MRWASWPGVVVDHPLVGVQVAAGSGVAVAAAAGEAPPAGGGGELLLPVAGPGRAVGEVALGSGRRGPSLVDVAGDFGRAAVQCWRCRSCSARSFWSGR